MTFITLSLFALFLFWLSSKPGYWESLVGFVRLVHECDDSMARLRAGWWRIAMLADAVAFSLMGVFS